MATRQYESVVILNATLEDPQIEEIITSIHHNIKTNGGEITDVENWGRKRLAYAINNAKSGYYLITRFVAAPSMISEFERSLKLDENVIRYLTIALDKKALEYLKNAANKKEEPASEQGSEVLEKSTLE
ncbi:MAG: 30S ribosomal protein S6 [Ignavibacteriae bacterium]|nr:30S ribosomal protein S6 [Ignavibacteriota bacterium]